jgi:NitT/TauT family transport system permease protein
MKNKTKIKKDFSKQHENWLKKIKTDKKIILSVQIVLLIMLIGFWELFTQIRVLDPFFFSSPSRIVTTLISLFKSGELLNHIGITLIETILGFTISTLLGTAIAIGFWWNKKLRHIFEPYLVVFNALPKIALGPLIVIWFGTGMQSILVMCILICLIMTTMTMLHSFLTCDPDKILLMQSMGASKTQIFFFLIFPSSFGDLISVLKINVGLSWVGTIMGEYLASRAGLGYLIVYGGLIFNINLVMASTTVLCILAGVMYFIVSKIEKVYKK